MRGPVDHSTNEPRSVDPAGDGFVYHLTSTAHQLLAEHEQSSGKRLHRPAARTADLADAADREAKRQRREALRRRARRRGRRFGTVSYRWRETQYLPALRVSGKWLRRAGFDIGQEFEITVDEGQLIIEAV